MFDYTGFDIDEDEISNVRISMVTGTVGEREKEAYYITSSVLLSTRIATSELATALGKWRSEWQLLRQQFEVVY